MDTRLYGLNGRVVRVALPRLVPQKTQVPVDTVSLIPDNGARVTVSTELVHNVTALAEKALVGTNGWNNREGSCPSRHEVRVGRRGDKRGAACSRKRCGAVGRASRWVADKRIRRGIGRSRQAELADIAR